MEQKQQNPHTLFIMITGAVLIFQCLPQLSTARSITLDGLGVLSKEIVTILWATIIGLSLILVLLSILSLLPQLLPKLDRERLNILLLLIGAVFASFGLASINLSSSMVSSATQALLPLGIELFSLGLMSLALFVDMMDTRCVVKDIPNYVFLLFFMFLVPAAFMIPS